MKKKISNPNKLPVSVRTDKVGVIVNKKSVVKFDILDTTNGSVSWQNPEASYTANPLDPYFDS